MKVRYGDLKLKNGKTIEQAMKRCIHARDCGLCEYHKTSECCLLSEKLNSTATITRNVLDCEVEVPEASFDTTSVDMEKGDCKNVYICSPYRGCTLTNEADARRFCKWAIQQKGVMPLAPHIYFAQFFDDNVPDERQSGMSMGIKWLHQCSEIWVLGESLSDGMVYEIAEASRLGIPIRFFLENNEGFVERGEKK